LIGVTARRDIDWMAMQELFESAPVAAWLRWIKTFPVDRAKVDRRAVRTALERLEQGRVVGMFPEGGIRDGERSLMGGASMRPGVGALAQMSGAPVIPCVILGSDRLYAPESWWPFRCQFSDDEWNLGRRTPIWVAFGPSLTCTSQGKAAREEFERELTRGIIELSKELQATFALTSDDLPQPADRRKGRCN
jgi:1-acyl-sn-glycerol-3-phosphate acyltransferase